MKPKGYINEYLDYLRDERNLAPNTIKTYRIILNVFARWLGEGDFALDSTRDFLHYLAKEGWKTYSRNKALAALKGLANYLRLFKGFTEGQKIRELKEARMKPRIVDWFTEKEMHALIEAGQYMPDIYGIRINYTMAFKLQGKIGARWDEVASLKVKQLLQKREGIWVIKIIDSKTGERNIEVDNGLAQELQMFFSFKRRERNDYMFQNRYHTKISNNQANEELRKRGAVAGIDIARCRTHNFRKGWGTLRADSGWTEYEMMRVMGIRDSKTLRKYIDAAAVGTEKNRTNPLQI